ncbi:ZC3H3 protein, partial [Psilopogon haemacephalus]|nr:ZC3H3 protein [Psilopogon haemacephalus]
SCGSSSENAVALKSEPQQHPLVMPGHDPPSRYMGRRKAEPPASGQPSCEQGRDHFREQQLFGSGEMGSGDPQAANLVVGVTQTKSRFSVAPKATGLQRGASTSLSSKSPKFRKTNYTWVANPGKCSRAVKRWASPRALESAKKVVVGADKGAKVSPKADLGTKLKKSGLQSKVGVSPSKYKWKASSLQTSPSTSKSAFRWRSEDQKKPPAPSLSRAGAAPPAPSLSRAGAAPPAPSLSRAGAAPPPPSTATSGLGGPKSFGDATLSSYKVKSRTKIIKRKGNSGSTTDKKNISPATPLKGHFHLRKKNSLKGKTSATPKRSSPKGLVQITKHRLCRLPATRMQVSTKEGRNNH